jgi:hypothetical protein
MPGYGCHRTSTQDGGAVAVDVGRIGIWCSSRLWPDDPGAAAAVAAELEELRYQEAIARRVGEHHQAGADHVCVQVLTGEPGLPRAQWRVLAGALA